MYKNKLPPVAFPIPLVIFTQEGKLKAILCGCTQKEYDAYMRDEDVNTHTVPANFATKYFTLKKCSVNDIERSQQLSDANKKRMVDMWSYSNTLTMLFVHELLSFFNLDYNEFIDAYCQYLKTLEF